MSGKGGILPLNIPLTWGFVDEMTERIYDL